MPGSGILTSGEGRIGGKRPSSSLEERDPGKGSRARVGVSWRHQGSTHTSRGALGNCKVWVSCGGSGERGETWAVR